MPELSWRPELAVTIIVALIVGLILFSYSITHLQTNKFRFSLRTLLIATTVVALLLGGWLWYRGATLAHVTWLPVTSRQFEPTFSGETVRQHENGRFAFTYYPRRRSVSDLLEILVKRPEIWWAEHSNALDVSAADQSTAAVVLNKLRAADVLPPGTFVIRGRVTDSEGQPLARATIDLLGPYVFINHFKTRDDGTFTMLLSDSGSIAPPGSGYYLRIRASEETKDHLIRWETPYFTLDPKQPERVGLIVAPR